jgi:tetratricopeptide (TPR) repeat protein
MARPQDAITGLVKLLEVSPADPESWSELSDLYLSLGMYQQSIFSLEEVLLITPNAWNVSNQELDGILLTVKMQARMGEIHYMWSKASKFEGQEARENLRLAVKWFCRSIELCDDYIRGYYGLKLVSASTEE